MKTITIHIGNPKTGTSSIQKTLMANKKILEKQGILYPLLNQGLGRRRGWSLHNHRKLIFLAETDREKWGRAIQAKISKEEAERVVAHEKKNLHALIKEIDRSSANKVVISAEGFGFLNEDAVLRLKGFFSPIDARIKIVCYYRHPAMSYLSKITQKTKASGRLDLLENLVRPISKKYSTYNSVFPDDVSIRLFDRSHLKQGDVVVDFLSSIGVDDQTIASLKKVEANLSNPAEVVAAQHWLRKRAFLDLDAIFGGANKKLNQALYQAAKGMELNRPKLAPGVAETVLYENRHELRWLAAELGLVFQDIDYDLLDHLPQINLQFRELDELLLFDPEKTNELIAKTVRILCES